MPYYVLLLPCLFLATPTVAQRPAAPPAPAAQSPTDRTAQYYQDYLERLRAVYFATGDPRATFLLSTATEELGARRRALQQEIPATQRSLGTPSPAWRQQLAELNKTPQAVKFMNRCLRNPALETAYQRFLDAHLEELFPAR